MTDLISAIALMFPDLRKTLKLARRCLKGCRELLPTHSAVPITKDLLLAFVDYLMYQDQAPCAVALALPWAGYLRGSEVIALRRRDIVLPGDVRVNQHDTSVVGVNILDAKTGPCQFVPIQDPEGLSILQYYLKAQRFPPDKKALPITYSQFLNLIRQAADTFQLQDFAFITQSARIGGALHDFCNTVSADTIATTGRWKTLSSLQYYLTNGRAWLLK